MDDFKVGDQVKVVSAPWNVELKNKTGKVVEIMESSRTRNLPCIYVTFSGTDRFLFLPKEITPIIGEGSQVKE